MNDAASKSGSGATRRDFIKGVVMTSGAVALGLEAAQAPAVQASGENPKRLSKGYEETQHVRDYYRSARTI